MNFKCLKNASHKFEVPKPEEIEGIWHWKDKVFCPLCGSPELEEELMVVVPKRDLSVLRKENADRSREARQMANEAMDRQNRENPEITLNPIQGSKTKEPIKIRKSIIDSLESKKPESYA